VPLKTKIVSLPTPTKPEEHFRVTAQTHEDDVPINKLKKPCISGSVPVVLFFNGTFCPIHAGHVNTMETAKTYLESQGVRIFQEFSNMIDI
jgi:bifunctional ADP-heptose synthase (sugar kinase/adenylyltransferase)